jgi:hypothetical protein
VNEGRKKQQRAPALCFLVIISVIATATSPSAPVYLAGKNPSGLVDGRTSPRDLKVREKRAAQVQELFRANAVIVFDRGNRQVSISFTTRRVFDTVSEAQQFILDHPGQVPTSGTVAILGENDSGRAQNRYYAGAMIEMVDGSHIGATTIHSYQITAPPAQLNDPGVSQFSSSQ